MMPTTPPVPPLQQALKARLQRIEFLLPPDQSRDEPVRLQPAPTAPSSIDPRDPIGNQWLAFALHRNGFERDRRKRAGC